MRPARRRQRSRFLAALGATVAIAFAGCGSDEESETTAAEGSAPATGTGPAQGGPPVGDGRGGVRLRRIGEFDQPLYVVQAPGGEELYVVEKEGRVRVVRDGEALDRPFLDISGEVSAEGEQGLLSIAFEPGFSEGGRVYVYFTDSVGDQRVVEFRASRERVREHSRRELLLMDDYASNHNGGLLVFGPDERLYIGTGDGGGAGDPERTAQDLSSLLGKLLRIDPRPAGERPYRIPADNPFAGRAGARGEVYSYGLRNPWRYSFDLATGDLTIGDVGQNSLEEVDFVRRGRGRGANFGWSAFEGTEPLNSDQRARGAIPPVLTYGRDRGCSVTGGYVVRDRRLRSLYGRYLYGDYCSGELRSAVLRPGEARGDRALGPTVPSLSSFGQSPDGRIYATSLEGPVYELVPE